MSSLRVKVAGVILAILVVSMDFTPHILLARLLAQQQSYEDFLKRLEEYLRDAIPPESDPIKECEYIAPEGLNPPLAERLWRDLAPFVSLGFSEQDIRDSLAKIYSNATIPVEVNGGNAVLNLTGLRVEKQYDGSVKAKIPVVSDRPLNYTYFNSTNVRILYETWNETLVRYYKVEKYTGLYRYVFKDLKYGTVFEVVSRLAFRTFPGFELERCVFFRVNASWGPWGYFMANPVVAVPGRYEEVSVVVPQQEVNYRVLFPAYDPVYTPSSEKPWRVNTNISSTSLSTGETLKICYWAEYMPYEPMGVRSLDDGGEEPLNATLTLEVTDAFQPLDGTARVLDNDHLSGFFELRAVKQGLHNITLRLEGNARFSLWPGGQELVYTVQVVGPTSPSVSFSYTLDPSLLKHARLTLELSNNGGSTARDVLVEMWGEYAESVSRIIGDIEVGETKREVFTIGLSNPSSCFNIRVSYFDDEGNKYIAEAFTGIWTNLFVVPEHYEEYTVVIPEHEETRMVFIPDAEYYTHVRLYRLTFAHEAPGICAPLPTVNGHYSGVELNLISHLTFTGMELSASSFESETAYKGDMVMLDLEQYWENTGIFDEKSATELLGVDPSMLRANRTPEGYRTSLVEETWVSSKRIIMDATEFAIYNQTISNYIIGNNLQGEFRIGWNKITNATRFSEPSDEKGFLTLIYHPLSIRGSGPLKSIQVRNYHGCNLTYRLRVYRYEASYGAPLGQPPKPPIWESFTNPFEVASLGDSVLLASSLASEGYSYHIQLLQGSNVVAETYFDLYPEPSPFWTGFWEGLKSQWLKIVLTGALMIILNVATGGTVGSLALKLAVLAFASVMIVINAVSQYQELSQIIFASHTLKELGSIIDEYARDFEKIGYLETAGVFKNAAEDVQRLVEALGSDLTSIIDFISRVCTDMSLEEWEILLGLRDAEPYAKGFAWGKAVGNAISLIEFLIGFCHLALSGATPASLGAKAKTVLQGVWNWLTPSLTDALSLIRNTPKLAKGFSMLLTIFSNAKKLGYSIIDVLKMDTRGAMDLAGISGKFLDKINELAKNRRISDVEAKAVMELCSKATVLGGEAVGKLNGDMEAILSKNAEFAGKFSSWALSTEANMKWVVETAGMLSELEGGELKNMGEALAKVGDSLENGVKLFNAYFDIPARYEESVVETVKKVFLRYVAEDGTTALSTWCSAIENGRIAARCSGDRVYPRIPEDLAQAYGFEGGEPFTVIIKRGGEEYWVAGRMQKATTYVTPHEKMFENLGLTKGEYVELIPEKIEEASLFPALRSGAGRVDYHFSEKWDSIDGIWISQKGGEGFYLTSCRRIGYLDDMGVFHSEPKETSYYLRKVELGGKLEFDVDEVSKEGFTLVYEIKAWKIGSGELGDAVKPLVEKGWVLFDESTGEVRLAGFQEFGGRGFEYEGKIAADKRHHGGIQAVFVLNPGDENERALAVRIVANPATGKLESRLDFSYDFKLGDWLDVTGLKKGIDKDGSTLFQIKHQFRVTAEETLWINTYMKWNPDSNHFKDAEVHIGTDFFREGVEKWLQLDFEVEQVETNKIKLRISKDMVKEYKSLFLEVKNSYEEHAKGVLSSEILNKVMDYEKIKRMLSISEDQRIVDKSGINKISGEEKFYFDIFSKKSETELTSVFEIKSTYAADENSLNLNAKLKDARNSLKERFYEVSNMKIKLPEDNYYAIVIGFTYYGDVYIVWQKFTKAEIMSLGD